MIIDNVFSLQKRRKPFLTADQKRKMVELRWDEYGKVQTRIKEIARILDINQKTVSKYLLKWEREIIREKRGAAKRTFYPDELFSQEVLQRWRTCSLFKRTLLAE
jgi:Mn-dependent DtxR family transcriptional regulator